MPLVTRRHFVRQTAFIAALYGCPVNTVCDARRLFDTDEQNGPPLDPATIRKLNSQLVGQIITPAGPEYETARMIFNRAFDRRPALIIRCAGASDVARALEFAQGCHLPLAVRGGGHSRLGYGMCDGGVVIDLSGMKLMSTCPMDLMCIW